MDTLRRRMSSKMDDKTLIRLDLGSGSRAKPGYIGVDINGGEEGVVQSDVLEFLRHLEENSVAEVVSRHFLEHVDDPREILSQIARVLRGGGEATIVVPHFSNPYYYSDPTHRRPFGLYTMSYYVHDSILRRNVPRYFDPLPLDLSEVRLRFRAAKSMKFTSQLFRLAFNWAGRRPGLCERYEFLLSGLIPCYEIEFRLRKLEGRVP
jgi:SAM-dependent methyltransferase